MPALASLICGFIFGSGLVISAHGADHEGLGLPRRVRHRERHLGPEPDRGDGGGPPASPASASRCSGRARRLFAPQGVWPTATDIDRPLITGAALFGIGWGLVGLCPGPAIADLATLSPGVFVFVIAMAVGMAAHDLWQARGARPIEQKLATATDG